MIPTADQVAAPLLFHDLRETLAGGSREAAKRVAVEVDEAGILEDEPVAEAGERVGPIESGRPGRVDRCRFGGCHGGESSGIAGRSRDHPVVPSARPRTGAI